MIVTVHAMDRDMLTCREVVALLASSVALARDEQPAPAWREVADLL